MALVAVSIGYVLVSQAKQRAEEAIEQRALVQVEALLEANIGVGLHFKALHLHRFYREQLGLTPGDLPEATRASESILSLPLFPDLTREDVTDVATALSDVIRRHAA